MDIEAVLRDCAKRKMSRTETRLMLGISQYKMRLFLSALPDIVWPGPGASLGNQRGNESRRGTSAPGQMDKARAVFRSNRLHTVRGVEGTITDLAKHFGVISPSCARNRVAREGMSVEAAVTTPAKPNGIMQYNQQRRKRA